MTLHGFSKGAFGMQQFFVSILAIAAICFAPIQTYADTHRVLSILGDQATAPALMELAEAFEKDNPGIAVVVDIRPGGVVRENQVRTRLQLGKMHDLFSYNVGAQMLILDPKSTLHDLSESKFASRIDPSFAEAASFDGALYAAPLGTAMAGGVLYNRDIYKRLHLSEPETWDQFLRNNETIKAVGLEPIAFSLATSWTSQIPFLADFSNIRHRHEDFVSRLINGEVVYETMEAGRDSFHKMEQLSKLGFVNDDAETVIHQEAIRRVANGEAGHVFSLSFSVEAFTSDIPGADTRVGFFPIPPRDALEQRALTIWMPQGLFIPKSSKVKDLAIDFLEFAYDPSICSRTQMATVAGPSVIRGCVHETQAYRSNSDIQAVFETGFVTPALEFLTPLKGPSLEVITTELLAGRKTTAEAVEDYSADLRRRALELELPEWQKSP